MQMDLREPRTPFTALDVRKRKKRRREKQNVCHTGRRDKK
jgi:hypothetical protein